MLRDCIFEKMAYIGCRHKQRENETNKIWLSKTEAIMHIYIYIYMKQQKYFRIWLTAKKGYLDIFRTVVQPKD